MADFFKPAERGVQHASLRAANRRAVLTAIALTPGLSNAEVSRRTGLAPQTASAIVTELEDDGLVTRGEVLRGRRGQPATPLFLDHTGAYGIGCEISWRHLDIMLVNVGGEELGRYRRDFAYPDARTIVEEAAGAIADLISTLEPGMRRRVTGIGLASPSHMNRLMTIAGVPEEQVALWSQLDLTAALENATALPTTWFNDGNCACFAQVVMSPAPRPPNLVHLFVSTYLGAGLTAEHRLWEGPTGNSANLGSMLVNNPAGLRTTGHDLASHSALARRLAADGLVLPAANPADWPWAEWEPHVAPWIEHAGAAMAEIIANTAAVLEVDHVIIDSTSPQGIIERLVAATDRSLAELIGATRPQLAAGKLGSRATPLGAAQLTMFRKHFSRDLGDMLGDDA
ncbi:MAG: ROK family transcriptional regulator [Devosia sp.]|uniref:ROK family transcriptional regulator n=2 Tax=Devosia sp. TaxID=1871048 RepID=UPI001AC1BEB1|nr:ROK family transcriptional regulator [Devosia sp.]MBN9317468.1 ROK family transcriptional regulator [Devosia sp.]